MTGGQSSISFLSWRTMPMPAGGLRLAVEDGEVDAARVGRGDHLGDAVGTRAKSHPAEVGRGTAADRRR